MAYTITMLHQSARALTSQQLPKINENGQVVICEPNSPVSIWLWQNGRFSYLHPPPDPYFVTRDPKAINNSGQVVGSTCYGYDWLTASIWKNGTPIVLPGVPTQSNSDATAINNLGQVVGQSDSATTKHAVLWQNGAVVDLGIPQGAFASEAEAINDQSQIVGYAEINTSGPAHHHAMLWQNGVMTDLNSLLPTNSGWVLTDASGINNKGQIVGVGTYNGDVIDFLLTLSSSGASLAATPTAQTTLTVPVQSGIVHGGGYDVLSFPDHSSGEYSLGPEGFGSFWIGFEGTHGVGDYSSLQVDGIMQLQFTDKTLTLTHGDQIHEYLALLYQATFGRPPDAPGLAAWEQYADALSAATTWADGAHGLWDPAGYGGAPSIADRFVNSAEFETKYGNLNNTDFITQLYANVLDRSPDAAGLNAWVSAMNGGVSRARALVEFATSTEAHQGAIFGFSGQHGHHAAWLSEI